ncbi:hypothetical protein G6011_01341 [Alternaria panax]|uniref:Uncharacterized protein n=1 Tax=Alternaria panax TaxID=48097 RepID=A0AAD4IKM5_9PLEO|nr:hypothetical protein G6011_01341 [Alternaria panax]
MPLLLLSSPLPSAIKTTRQQRERFTCVSDVPSDFAKNSLTLRINLKNEQSKLEDVHGC